MSVVVAATSQFLFKRNFNENRWARVGNNMCKVQVVEKGGAFYFKINDGNGVSWGWGVLAPIFWRARG